MKKISSFTKRNLLLVGFALCICLSISLSAYLVSINTTLGAWNVSITHASSTPTPTLSPDTGWWNAIATPTPKQ